MSKIENWHRHQALALASQLILAAGWQITEAGRTIRD
jgi:hypothetical protein